MRRREQVARLHAVEERQPGRTASFTYVQLRAAGRDTVRLMNARWAPITVACLIACHRGTPGAGQWVVTVDICGYGRPGDPSAAELSRLAEAGADIEPPRKCGTDYIVVVHGRGRHKLAKREAPPLCASPDAGFDDCPEVDPTAFWNDYEGRLQHLGVPLRAGKRCGDAGSVLGGPLVGGWWEADPVIGGLAKDFARWDLDTTMTVFVGDEELCGSQWARQCASERLALERHLIEQRSAGCP